VGWGLGGALWIGKEYLVPTGFESQTIQHVANNVLEYQNKIKTKLTKILRREPTSDIIGNFPPVVQFPVIIIIIIQ
jgi:hypothetical protein